MPPRTRMTIRRALLVAALVTVTVALLLDRHAADLALWSMRPGVPFDAAHTPPATDYTKDASWLALPTTQDEADVVLPELPASLRPAASVFFVHSTSNVAAVWNARDEGDVRAASIRGGTLIQASVFNGCCAVYAPGYTQATGLAFVQPSQDGAQAIHVAYADVLAAFEAFLGRIGQGPFLIAGHSQGSFLAARLLRERIARGPERGRLVAAYLIGAPLTRQDVGDLPACAARGQTGCVITFNARGPHHARHPLEFGGALRSDALCVHPVLGQTSEAPVSAKEHGGAVFFDTARPQLLPRFVGSRCSTGRLVIDELAALPDRGLAPSVLLRVMGGENYHSIEYQLFYVDLRLDAMARVQSFVSAAVPGRDRADLPAPR